ncbi:AMP-binding protein [Vibrio sp. PP-XX7]
MKPCAPGTPGEMLVSGYGVTRGYHNRPELNDHAFISFPGIEGHVFRSGDLARRTPQGELIYLGRKDAQVQLRGFRH